jgi:hypothetical protein
MPRIVGLPNRTFQLLTALLVSMLLGLAPPGCVGRAGHGDHRLQWRRTRERFR